MRNKRDELAATTTPLAHRRRSDLPAPEVVPNRLDPGRPITRLGWGHRVSRRGNVVPVGRTPDLTPWPGRPISQPV